MESKDKVSLTPSLETLDFAFHIGRPFNISPICMDAENLELFWSREIPARRSISIGCLVVTRVVTRVFWRA